jgi:hypothetical protein
MRGVPLEGISSSEENVDKVMIGSCRLPELIIKPYCNEAGNVLDIIMRRVRITAVAPEKQ